MVYATLDNNAMYQSNNGNGYGNFITIAALSAGNHQVEVFEWRTGLFGKSSVNPYYIVLLFIYNLVLKRPYKSMPMDRLLEVKSPFTMCTTLAGMETMVMNRVGVMVVSVTSKENAIVMMTMIHTGIDEKGIDGRRINIKANALRNQGIFIFLIFYLFAHCNCHFFTNISRAGRYTNTTFSHDFHFGSSGIICSSNNCSCMAHTSAGGAVCPAIKPTTGFLFPVL
jgi:hypothetical protein